jgi:glycine betaine/proline transport system substrate-binding protein
MKAYFKRIGLAATLLVLALLVAACNGAMGPTTAPATDTGAEGANLGDTTITLGYMNWTDCEAFTNIAAEVLRAEGYTVETVAADAGVVYQSLADDQIDAMLCSWQPGTHEDYVNTYQDEMQEATVNLEGAQLGWVVPSYVEIDSIADLQGRGAEFNGQIVGIDPGAGLMRLSAQALDEYGLAGEYDLVESSDAAMTAALDRAISQNEPIVVTAWAPHIMWARYDVKWLEDPQGVLGDAEHISTMVRSDLPSDSPRAYQILSQMTIAPETLASVMLEVQEGKPVEQAAQDFVAAHGDLVSEWTRN